VKTFLFAAAVSAVLISGCSYPSTGTVIGKHYEPKRTYSSCSLVGKITVCSPRTDDEDWVVTLRNGDTEWDEEVSEDYYNAVENGDRWVRSN
jgi:hypothetical protein